MKVKVQLLVAIVCFWLTMVSNAAFIIRHIRVEGNQHIRTSTVLDYVPVKLGQRLNQADLSHVINSLYATGLFNDVALARLGNTLVVKVTERPTIAKIDVTGNHSINKDKLKSVLSQVGLVNGATFDRAILARLKLSLETTYEQQGRYNARVTTKVASLPRNRVAVTIIISEGITTKVAKIEIIGHHAFSQSKLLDQFQLTTPKLWSFLTGGDHFSRVKLNKDLENLRNFYFNHGYLRMQVESSQATLTPDRKHVYIVIRVHEGPVYKLVAYHFKGKFLGQLAQIKQLVKFKINQPFSRQQIIATNQAIGNYFGNLGYATAQVNAIPRIDDKAHQVSLTVNVQPGQLIYVRRINFIGNIKTADYVLRQEMRQMEGGLISTKNLRESMRRLRNLGYIADVHYVTKPVPNTDNQVDVDVHMKEAPGGRLMLSLGYSTDGILYGAGITQENFLGTGRTVSLNMQQSRYQSTYNFTYINPYYTQNGISRSINVYRQHTTPGWFNQESYAFNNTGFNLTYGIPISEYANLSAGVGLENVSIDLGTRPTAQSADFIGKNGYSFNHGIFNLGWGYSDLDQYPFATKGIKQNLNLQLSVPAGSRKLEYYKGTYTAHYFHPLIKHFVAEVGGTVGAGQRYGKTTSYPFFMNYTAGGPDSVRGYETNSLGPKDPTTNVALGGNLVATATAALILPSYISKNVRTSLFLDGGNVYNTHQRGNQPFRYSAGFGVQWRLALLGEIRFDLAKAINPGKGDVTQFFQFSFGTNF